MNYILSTNKTSNTMEFLISEDMVAHFIGKVNELKRTARKCGADLTFSIEENADVINHKTESGYKWKEYFSKVTVTSTVETIIKDGYKFIGTITPVNTNGNTKMNRALVTLTGEFLHNIDIMRKLQDTPSLFKCDCCNRTAERGIYYAFIENSTGKILKFGSHCAKKHLGIEVNKKLSDFFFGLNSLGDLPYAQYDPDGDFVGMITKPVMASINCDGEIYEYIDNCFTAFAYAGPYSSAKNCAGLIEQIENYYSNKRYAATKGEYFVKNDKIEEAHKKAIKMHKDFFDNIAEYCEEKVARSTFEENMFTVGIFLGCGTTQKKRINKFLRFIPYIIFDYFKSQFFGEKVAMKAFSGRKDIDCKIEAYIHKDGSYGEYYQVYATTNNGESITWFDKKDNGYKPQDKLKINAEYSKEFEGYAKLNYVVNVVDMEKEEKAKKDVPAYPEDKTRIRDTYFTVLKNNDKFIIVKDDEGREYYISNERFEYGQYDYYNAGIKFSEEVMPVDGRVKLSGTVNLYISRKDGKQKASLKRVMIR